MSIAKAGRLICVDEGEYSDYGVKGFFVALRDFEPMKELAEYLAANPTDSKGYGFKDDAFLASLIAKGYLLEIEYDTIYLGTYGHAKDVAFHLAPETSR